MLFPAPLGRILTLEGYKNLYLTPVLLSGKILAQRARGQEIVQRGPDREA